MLTQYQLDDATLLDLPPSFLESVNLYEVEVAKGIRRGMK